MGSDSRSSVFRLLYPDIVQLYVLDGLKLNELQKVMEQREPGLKLKDSEWKNKLRAWGIHKNISYADADFILTTLKRMGYGLDQCLVLSGGILLDIREVQRYLKRKGKSTTGSELSGRMRLLIFIPLLFTFSRLSDLEFFKGFRRLLWYTSVHFDSCFDTGKWTMDKCGVYCRSEVLRSGLSDLSRMQNMVCDALKHSRRGDHDKWRAGVRAAFNLNRSVVQTHHHRQFSDLLAIALLLERHLKSELRTSMAEDLYNWAKLDLPVNDTKKEHVLGVN